MPSSYSHTVPDPSWKGKCPGGYREERVERFARQRAKELPALMAAYDQRIAEMVALAAAKKAAIPTPDAERADG